MRLRLHPWSFRGFRVRDTEDHDGTIAANRQFNRLIYASDEVVDEQSVARVVGRALCDETQSERIYVASSCLHSVYT